MTSQILTRAALNGFFTRRTTSVTPTRDNFVVGTTKPIPGVNTGVLPGVTRTVNTRTSFTGTNIEVMENQTFPNKVTISGSNKIFINCLFEGRTGTSECVSAYAAGAGTSGLNTFTDCSFMQPASMFPFGFVGTAGGKIGIRAHHVRLLRCDFQNLVDGARPRNAISPYDCDFQMLGCSISNLLLLSPDGGQANAQSHSDGIQDDNTGPAQSNVLFDGCLVNANLNPLLAQAAIAAYYNTDGSRAGGNLQYPPWLTANNGFQLVSPSSGTKLNYVITRCWLYGGSYLVNAGGITNVQLSFTNNRCGRDMRLGQTAIINIPNAFVFEAFSGNVYEDDGSPANIRHNG